jgi:hypothetical protein
MRQQQDRHLRLQQCHGLITLTRDWAMVLRRCQGYHPGTMATRLLIRLCGGHHHHISSSSNRSLPLRTMLLCE